MTQSTLRLLIGGLLTVGLLSSLARGDDKNRPPELLPPPHCEACDKAESCCTPGAPCCQENGDCCTKSNPKPAVFSVGAMPAGVDFNRAWGPSCPSEEAKKKQIMALMTQYHTLYKENKFGEAEICAIKARNLDPDNNILAAAVQEAHMAKAHAEYVELGKDQWGHHHIKEEYIRLNVGGAEKPGPAVNLDNPITLDPRPKPKMDRSAMERKINRRLDDPVTAVEFRDTPLQQVLDDLANWSQINVILDTAALKEAKINLSQPITMKLENASLKKALKLLLLQANLTYEVANEALVITTRENALGKLERRVFPLSGLVSPSVLGAKKSEQGMQKEDEPYVKLLVSLIQKTIEPQSWNTSDGPGKIEIYPPATGLLVNQTPEIQEKVQDFLDAFRRLQEHHLVKENNDCCPKAGTKVPSFSCEVVPVGTQFSQLWDPCCQPAPAKAVQGPATQPTIIVIQQPSSELAQFAMWAACSFAEWASNGFSNPEEVNEENATPQLQGVRQVQAQAQSPVACSAPTGSNVPPGLQQFPVIMTRDADGTTRVGVDFGSCATGQSPLPPPVPTFRVPTTVNGEKPEQRPASENFQFLNSAEFQIPVLAKDQSYSVTFSDSGTIQPNLSLKDYRVSRGTGVRLTVPMLGPVPFALDFGAIPVTLTPQLCTIEAPRQMLSPVPMQAWLPPEPSTPQAPQVHQAWGTPVPYHAAVPVSYMPPVMPSPKEKPSTNCWTMRVHADGEAPGMSANCGSASMVCKKISVKWKPDSTLLFEAEKKCIRVCGVDFEAEAEAVECHENEGKLVLTGNVKLTHYENGKCDCSVHAERVVWGSEGIILKTPGSLK